ncbi:MAG: helical backbone metal receptor [Candidatus Kaelpia imicola]|nr:helical backbone metal receptor [Candidatus Kaelpia imicola]
MLVRILIILIIGFFLSNAHALRIISLSPYLTESILLLDGGDSLVGITTISKKLFGIDKEVVGDTLNINIEKVVSLKPDIILATPMNKIERVERIKGLGFRVEYFEIEKSFEDCCNNFMKLAEMINKVEKAKIMIAESKERLGLIARKLKSGSIKNIFIEVGCRPLITAGRNCYLNDLAQYSGAYNVASDIGSSFFRITRERVLELDPEYILILSEDYLASSKAWGEYDFLIAVKNKNLIKVNKNVFSRPNPVNFVQAVYMLSSKINPEILNED